jgi:hypothetical protein
MLFETHGKKATSRIFMGHQLTYIEVASLVREDIL